MAIRENIERAKDFFREKKKAYGFVFGDTNNVSVQIVLKDLAKFCRANKRIRQKAG